MNETGVKIIIEGDATGAVAAARQASDALTQLQADTVGPGEEPHFQLRPADGPPDPVRQPAQTVRKAAGPARELNQPPVAEAGIVEEFKQFVSGLEQALHSALMSPPNPVTSPLTVMAGVNNQSAEPGPAAEPARLPGLPEAAPAGEPSAPARDVEPAATPQPGQPSGPVSTAGPATPIPDGAAPANATALAGPPTATETAGSDARPPAGQPGQDQALTPDQGLDALQKLRELNDITGRNAMLMAQMFDSMIQSQRATARIQTAQQAEIKALTAQLQTLLAQMDNTQFNTR